MQTIAETKLYIDGGLRRAKGEKTYDNINPWTGEVAGQRPRPPPRM